MINPFKYKNKEEILKNIDSEAFLKQLVPVIRTVIQEYITTSHSINFEQLAIAIITSLTTYLRTLWTGGHPDQAERAAVTMGESFPQSVIVGNILTEGIKNPLDKISKTLDISSDLISKASLSALPDIPSYLKDFISGDIKVLLKIFTNLPNKNKTAVGSGKIDSNITKVNTSWLDPGFDISDLNTDDVIKGSGFKDFVSDLWNGIWGTKVPEEAPSSRLPSSRTLNFIELGLRAGERILPFLGSLTEGAADKIYQSMKDSDFTPDENDSWGASMRKGLGRAVRDSSQFIRDKINNIRTSNDPYNIISNYDNLSAALHHVLPAMAQDQYEYEQAYRQAAALHNYQVTTRRKNIITGAIMHPLRTGVDVGGPIVEGVVKSITKKNPLYAVQGVVKGAKNNVNNISNILGYTPLAKPFMPQLSFANTTKALATLPPIQKKPIAPKVEVPKNNTYIPPPMPVSVNPMGTHKDKLRTQAVGFPRKSFIKYFNPIHAQQPIALKANRTPIALKANRTPPRTRNTRTRNTRTRKTGRK